ncbi:MAG: tetratricopeptide repeat protein [Blastocatellia bacterium]
MAATVARTTLIFILLVGLAAPALAQRRTPAQKKRPVPQAAPTTQQKAAFDKLSGQADEAREAGRLEDAIRLYNQALQLNPKWMEGWWYLGSIFYDRDRYTEASEALKILLSLKRENGLAWTLLGLCEFQLRNYKEALADLLYGKQLGVGDNKAFINVARYHGSLLLNRNGQFEMAFEEMRPFAREGNESLTVIEAFGINVLRMPLLPSELPPDKRELVLLAGRAGWHQAARHPQEADRAFKELLSRYPDAPNANYAYGVFQLIDTPDAALESFRRELQIKPDNVPAMLQVAFEYIKRNDYEQALPFAQKAVERAPDFFVTHNALGRVLLEVGKVQEAIKELETGVRQAPDSPEMRFALARAYAKAGRREDARRERELFLQLDKQMREQREGTQSIGGVDNKPADKQPPLR